MTEAELHAEWCPDGPDCDGVSCDLLGDLKSLPEIRLVSAAKGRNRARRIVLEWMRAEGEKGNLRRNSDAPSWQDYERAESDLLEAIADVGE